MAFEPNSRYYAIATTTFTDDEGEQVTHLRRRFLPKGEDMPLLVEVEPGDGDRLDLIAHRTLGDPLAFWRVCDANNAMHPGDLVGFWRYAGAADPEHEGRKLEAAPEKLRVPVPQVNA